MNFQINPNLTTTLCTQCGLCCDGSLFADVELASDAEAASLEVMGLEIEEGEENGELLLQPCKALQGRRCSIYPHRPECCRTFECRLLQNVRRGAVSIDQAKEKIASTLSGIERIKKLLAHMGQDDERSSLKERCMEVLTNSEQVSSGRANKQERAELEREMKAVETLIYKTFL
jgi:Fe-S-cluster containining protein